MVASPGHEPFDDPDYLFEPWWPGTRIHVFAEDGRIRLQAEHLSDPLDAFPELRDLAQRITLDGCVIDATLLVIDADGRPDPDGLRRRLGRPRERVGQPGVVAHDLLYAGGMSLSRMPFGRRRRQLVEVVREADWCVVGRAYPAEGRLLAEALEELGIAGLSARRMSAPWRAGEAGDAWLQVPLAADEAAPARPSLTLIQRLPL